MKYLEYLYFEYYSFQERVGNRDIAPFVSMLIIAFTLMLYYFSIFFLGILFIPQGLDMEIFKYVSVILFLFLIALLYFLFVYKNKYKVILKKYRQELTGRKRLGAIMFPLVAFLLFNLGWILKLMQNQGRF